MPNNPRTLLECLCNRNRAVVVSGYTVLFALSAHRACGVGTQSGCAPGLSPVVFSTHDVTLSGWRLRDFLRLLRDGKVAAVKTGNTRYADLRNDLPFVSEIKIAPVKTDG